MKIGVRADGGPDIGFGHIIRTAAFVAECLQRDDTIVFFTATPDTASTILPDSVIVEPLSSIDNPTEVREKANQYTLDTLFLDLFEADTTYQRILSKADFDIIVRHNYQHHTVCCDTLIYGDLHAVDLDYTWVGERPEFLLGPDYILLREQFREVARRDSTWRPDPVRALITMGGSDVANMTPAAMRAFRQFSGTVDVVIGPGFSNQEEIKQAAVSLPTHFNLLFDPEHMADLMYRADLAVSAVGGTVFELLAAQTPFIGIPQVENQLQRADALRRKHLARIISSDSSLTDEVHLLIHNSDMRRQLYDRMSGVVDGKGAQRIRDRL